MSTLSTVHKRLDIGFWKGILDCGKKVWISYFSVLHEVLEKKERLYSLHFQEQRAHFSFIKYCQTLQFQSYREGFRVVRANVLFECTRKVPSTSNENADIGALSFKSGTRIAEALNHKRVLRKWIMAIFDFQTLRINAAKEGTVLRVTPIEASHNHINWQIPKWRLTQRLEWTSLVLVLGCWRRIVVVLLSMIGEPFGETVILGSEIPNQKRIFRRHHRTTLHRHSYVALQGVVATTITTAFSPASMSVRFGSEKRLQPLQWDWPTEERNTLLPTADRRLQV